MRHREALAAYLFLSPAILLFLVFIAGPLVGAIVLSLFQWDLFSSPEFVGFQNFARLSRDSEARAAVANTFVFTFWSVVLHIGPGLLLAVAVNRAMPAALRYFLRTAYFFPLLVSWAAVALVWAYILDPNFGFITYYLASLGLPAPTFLIDPAWAMPAVIAVDLWRTIGFTFIILLAGLQGIPGHLYEAATVDGAGAFRKFWNITIPMLSPTLFFATVITFIGAFQIFEPMFIMTRGGPGDSTRSIVMHIFETGFRGFEMGYASALALVVFLVIMIVTLIQLVLSRYWVFYE
ncbi:MAG: sugar ABC transporter permease [Actinobacteria bacterium]|nr:MAG: sugar ABC transporter permease [Actinomycetota bacterium]